MSSREAACCSKPRIVVTNLRDGDGLPHSIVLVKGRVERQCPVNHQIVLSIDGGDPREQSESLSLRGEFKFLVDFGQQAQQQSHQLVLQHCRESLTLEVLAKPSRKPYRLQPLLITCQGQQEADPGEFAGICEKIDLNLRLVQCVYAEKLHEAGHGRLTFCLDSACRVFRCSLSLQQAWQLDEEQLWQHIAADLLAAFSDRPDLKFVAFVGCTRYDAAAVNASGDYSYANIRRNLRAHAALGGGGLALFGSAFFYAWPQHFSEILPAFRSQQAVDLRRQPDESNYRRTYGGVYASTLGAVCHELGHSFDLGHSRDGVMGDGFDYLNRVFLVEATTQHLPQRLVDPASQPPGGPQKRRVTQLKKTSCAFLDKYHEQKQNDSFFFSPHCALILANHKWLRHDATHDSCGDGGDSEHEQPEADESVIVIDPGHQAVESKGRHGLILVEVRSKAHSLVDSHYDLRQPHRSGASSFHFPAKDRALLFEQQTHYVYAMTSDGRGEKLLLSC